MKVLFFLLLTLNVSGQFKPVDTAYKNYSDTSGVYLIRYVYKTSSWFYPLVLYTGDVSYKHYSSVIDVYRIIDCKCFYSLKDTVFVRRFDGWYSPSGCCLSL